MDDQDYQFLDMFESSIGLVTNRESQLFNRFNNASAMSAKWLQHHRRRPARGLSPSIRYERTDEDPVFPDALLDIGVETSLLAEIKDIRDELNILAVVLDSQMSILVEFESHIIDELRPEGTRRVTEAIVHEIRKRSREQKRLLEVHRKDIDRMDRQAESIYMSLTHLLDLKQKHSNALEARFARDQAVIAARQGQTIMVFTIVTIIFLPMSFIAAFFAINFDDWNGTLTIGYVSKYMFGIGLGISVPLIAMAFTVNDIFDAVQNAFLSTLGLFRRRRNQGDEHVSEKITWDRVDTLPSAGRPSLADELPEWRKRGLDGPSWRKSSYDPVHERHNSAASPASAHRPNGGVRKFSVGSGNAISWARPSFERDRSGIHDDLERGRASGSAKVY